MKAVGARLPRYDGVAHVTGRTTFVDDVRVPGTLWAKALRSPVHHADITRLDTAEGSGDAGRPRGRHLGGRAAPVLRAPVRPGHPRGRAAAREGRRALQGPADCGCRRRGRGDSHGGRRRDRRRLLREADAVRHPPGRRSRRAGRPPVGQLVSAFRGRDGRPPDPQGRHRLGLRQGRRRSCRASTGRPRSSTARSRRRSARSCPSPTGG